MESFFDATFNQSNFLVSEREESKKEMNWREEDGKMVAGRRRDRRWRCRRSARAEKKSEGRRVARARAGMWAGPV